MINSITWWVEFFKIMAKILHMNRLKHILFITLLICCCKIPVVAQQTGNNTYVITKYKPPDIYYPAGRTIKLEKLDINKANIEQLMSLPEINEDLALKIARRRPIKSLQDLTHLPYIDINRMKIILKGLANLVIQPLESNDGLKQ